MAGFYKVPHDVDRALKRDPNTFRVYCEFASRARWTFGTCLGSHGAVALAPGQCVAGRAELAATLGLTERIVRTSIDRLCVLGFLTVETSKRGTLVTLRDDSASTEARPTERPSAGAMNDQPPAPRPPGLQEERSKNESTHTRARERHPAAGGIARRVWDYGAKIRGELAAANLSVPPWPLQFGTDHAGWNALLDRVCEQLVDSTAEQAEQVCRNRIDVAAAKARAAAGESNWFSCTAMWTPKSFASFAELDPKQFERKLTKKRERGPGELIGAAPPRNDHPDGRCSLPISIIDLGDAAVQVYERVYIEHHDVDEWRRVEIATDAAFNFAKTKQADLPLSREAS